MSSLAEFLNKMETKIAQPLNYDTQENMDNSTAKIKVVQWNSANSTSDNSKTCLTQTQFHGPCLGNDNLLGISQTFSHNSDW